MATLKKLARHATNVDAVNNGRWMDLGLVDDGPDIRVLIRGFTDEYTNAQNRQQHVAAKSLNGETELLGIATRRKINIELLCSKLILGVENMNHDADPEAVAAAKAEGLPEPQGRPYTVEEFKDLIRKPEWAEVADACFKAAKMVGKMQDEDLEAARPSSETPSSTS